MKVFITGANGFIGSNICRRFLARGWDVAGLVRPAADRHYLDGLAMEIVTGDLREPAGFDLPENLDAIVHSASVVSDVACDSVCRDNILCLAENLVEKVKALPKPPPRIIVVSTALTLGYAATGISETHPGRPADFLPYTRYKKQSEDFFLAEWRDSRLPVVILRPGDVFGPRDRTTMIKVIQGLEKGYPLIVGKGDKRFGYLHIGNFCQAVELSILTPGIEGRSYTVTNGELPTWREFFEALMAELGRKQRIYVPARAAFVAAFLQTSVHRIFSRFTPQLNYYRVKRVTTETTYDISRTIAELGYRPDDRYVEQIREMVAWYKEEKRNGFLP